MATYKGFSTINRARKFQLTDFELVKQDLYNHFRIRRGEKLMNPDFGTIIWDSIMEPFTQALKDAIGDDVRRIAAYDPRISVRNINITEFTDGIRLELDLVYVPTNQVDRLLFNFERQLNQNRRTAQ
jgi:phage baseplate assembly protein W